MGHYIYIYIYLMMESIVSVKKLSVGLLVGSITFEGIELFTSNLVHKWAFIRERFGLFLMQIGSGEGDEMEVV